MFPDIFNDEAFQLTALTNFIANEDYVPGRAGELAFAGTGMGVPTDKIALDWISDEFGLIPVTARGAPAPQEVESKGAINALTIPQVKLEDTISASQLLGNRAQGTTGQLRTAEMVIQNQIRKMNKRHDLTLEHLRLTALEGIIKDSDGENLLNLYTFFNASVPSTFDLTDMLQSSSTEEEFLTRCHRILRYAKRNIKSPWPSTAYLHSFAGDNFFDKVIERTRKWHDGYEAAERRLGDNYAFGMYEFGGIIWENYQGTDDNTTVAVPEDSARIFPVGIPGLYEEYYAPGDFLDVVGIDDDIPEVGLPRYARIALDGKFNRQVFLHTQANPIPICTRPQVLLKATFTPSTESEASET